MHSILLFIAKYLFIIIVLVAFIYWVQLRKEDKIQIIVFGVITAAITYALIKLGGLWYFDPRPFISNPSLIPLYPHGADNAFPSDHTALSTAVALTILSFNKKLGAILIILAVLVGGSRVIGHIHSPIDILGSLVFAAAGAIVAYYVTPKVLTKIQGNK